LLYWCFTDVLLVFYWCFTGVLMCLTRVLLVFYCNIPHPYLYPPPGNTEKQTHDH
jgi:hypothetical protein